MIKTLTRLILIAMLILTFVIVAIAQESVIDTHTVSFDGVSLTYASDFAQQVNISRYVGDPVETAGIGFSDAPSFSFQLYNPPLPELEGKNYLASVTVYELADIMRYEFMRPTVSRLSELIETQPDLSAYEPYNGDVLPRLPIVTHGQVIHAQAHYIENETLAGIAYISAIQAAAEPFLHDSFFYTLQAITHDERYYISANIYTLDVPTFPEEIVAVDIESFVASLDSYLLQSRMTLNAMQPQDFTPDLAILDALVLSMTFE